MTEPTLESLRAQGLHLREPLRFSYLEALSRRIPAQPPQVQRILQQRLQQAIGACLSPAVSPSAASASTDSAPQPSPSPLALLNRHIQERQSQSPVPHDDIDAAWGEAADPRAPQTLKSVRAFGSVWSKMATQQQVQQALQRGPDNAGPLNSHRLILRALSLMQDLSGAHLHRYLAQVDTLLWLDQANKLNALPQHKRLKAPTRWAAGGAAGAAVPRGQKGKA